MGGNCVSSVPTTFHAVMMTILMIPIWTLWRYALLFYTWHASISYHFAHRFVLHFLAAFLFHERNMFRHIPSQNFLSWSMFSFENFLLKNFSFEISFWSKLHALLPLTELICDEHITLMSYFYLTTFKELLYH